MPLRYLLGGLFFLWGFSAYAQEPAPSPTVSIPRVMMLVFQSRSDENAQIVESVQAQMFEVDVKFGVRWVIPEISGHEARLRYAQQVVRSEQLDLVIFWEESETDVLYYLLRESEQPMRREIVYAGETRRTDAIAIISRTAVESLLDTGQLESLSSRTTESSVEQPQESSTLAPPPSPTPLNDKSALKDAPASLSPSSSVAPRVRFQLGYELSVPNAAPTLLHTGLLRLGLQPHPYTRVYLGAGVSNPLVSTEAEVTVTQRRFPVEAGVLGVFQKNKIELAGGAAFVLVPFRNEAKSTNPNAVLKDAYWAQGAMLKLLAEMSLQLSRYFALYADLILLIRLNMVSYEVQNGPVLFDEFRRFWPGFQAGIAISAF